MVNFEDLDKERIAVAERILKDKANTLGKDGSIVSEPFSRIDRIALSDVMTRTPSATNGLIPPDYDDLPVQAAVGTRYEEYRLHSYLPSGLDGPTSVQTFITISSAPDSHSTSDIEAVRVYPLVSPKYSQSKSNAAHEDPNFRGFELVLYPAKSNGGPGIALVADTDKPISPVTDPGAGPPDDIAPGVGTEGNWSVDYEAGMIRFSRSPLNGPDGVMNPNNIYGDLEGLEVSDAYGAITMFATFYHYTGNYGTSDNLSFVTVGDGYVSSGIFTGQSHDTVQAAINSLPENGGTVFIKEGTYDFVNKVTIPQNVRIFGLGGAVIIRPPNEPAFFIQDGYVTIEGFEIQPRREGAVSLAAAIELGASQLDEEIKNVVIKNNTIYAQDDAPAIGFATEFDCVLKYLSIQNNLFIQGDNVPGIIYIGGRALGGRVGLIDCSISDNKFEKTNAVATVDYAINWPSTVMDFASFPEVMNGIKITDNQMRGLTIQIGDSSAVEMYGLEISRNYCKRIEINCNYLETLKIDENNVFGHSSTSDIQIYADDVNYFTINNNIVENSIYIDPSFGTTTFMYAGTISGNSTDGSIEIDDTNSGSELDDTVISGNHTYFIGTPKLWACNISSNFSGDIYISATAATSQTIRYSTISGNQLYTGDLQINNVAAADTTSSITYSSSIVGNAMVSLTVYGQISEQVTISSNEILGSMTLRNVSTLSSGDSVTISSNNILGALSASYIHNSSITGNSIGWLNVTNDISKCSITGNTISGSSSLQGIITDTIFSSNVALSASNSISTGGLTRCQIKDNTFTSCTWSIAVSYPGDINGTEFSGNKLGTVNIGVAGTQGNFLNSKFTDGYITTSLNFNNIVTNSEISSNDILGNLSLSANSTITNVHVHDNYITGTLTAGNVYKSKINNNVVNSTTTLSASFIEASNLYDNIFGGNTTLTGEFTDSKFTDGYVVGSLTIDGLIVNGQISNNRITNALSLGQTAQITNSQINNNIIGTNLTIGDLYLSEVNENITGSVVSISVVGPVQGSVISTNNFGGNTTIAGDFLNSKFTDGYVIGSLTLSGIVTNAYISNNRVTSSVSIAASSLITNSLISNNIVEATLTTGFIVGSVVANNISSSFVFGEQNNSNLVSNKSNKMGEGIQFVNSGELYITTGVTGKLATSPDGISWTQQTSSFGIGENIYGIAYNGKDLWVAVGDLGKLATSLDGITWTQRTSNFSAAEIYEVAYNGKDLWVAIGAAGELITSPDGITWNQRTSSFSSTIIRSVSHNNKDLWVIVGDSGKLATSPDGITWTQRTSSFSSTNISVVVHNNKDLWIAGGASGKIATSPDGITWTQRTSGFGSDSILGIAHNGKDLWVAVGGTGKLATSPDGITWTQQVSSFGSTIIRSVTYNGKDLWIAVSDAGKLATSPDGVTWTQQVSSFGSSAIFNIAICYNSNAGLVAHGSQHNGTGVQAFGHGNSGIGVEGFGGDGYAIGVKGVSGTKGGVGVQGYGLGEYAVGGEFFGGGFREGIYVTGGFGATAGIKSFGNGYFAIIAGQSGKLFTSIDGANWSSRISDFTDTIYDIHYNGKDLWVSIGLDGLDTRIGISTDGINWSSQTNVLISLTSIAYNSKDLWIIVGQNSSFMPALLLSPDGINWTEQLLTVFGSNLANAIHYNGKDLWVVTGASGKLATSPDGINWTLQTSSFGSTSIGTVAHNGKDLWIAGGGSGKIATSPDGINWTQRTSGFGASGNIYSIAYNGKDLWIAVGDDGTFGLISSSTDGVTWITQHSGIYTTFNKVKYNGKDLWFVGGYDGLFTSIDGVHWILQGASGFITGGSDPVHAVAVGHNSNAGLVAHGSQYNGTGVQAFGHGNGGIGVEGFGGDGYAIGVKGVSGLYGGAGIRGIGLSSTGAGGEFYTGGIGPGVYSESQSGAGIQSRSSSQFAVVTGNSGKIWHSFDGINWYNSATPITSTVSTLDYNGKDLWVAGGTGSTGIIYSPDGITWSTALNHPYGAPGIDAVKYGSGVWIAIGSTIFTRSTDGINWSTQFTAGSGSNTVQAIATDNMGTWIAAGTVGITRGYSWISRDNGISWTEYFNTSGFSASYGANAAEYFNGTWMLVGENGIISTSTDGINWKPINVGSASWTDIKHDGKDNWVVTSSSTASIYASQDTINWYPQSIPPIGSIFSIDYNGKDLWIVVGSAPSGVYFSKDLTSWTAARNAVFTQTPLEVKFAYQTNAGLVSYGGPGGAGVVGYGGGTYGAGVVGYGSDGYAVGVKGHGSIYGGTGVFGQSQGGDGYGVVGVGSGKGAGLVGQGGFPSGQGILSFGTAESPGGEMYGTGTMYIAVGHGNQVRVSYDGEVWKSQTFLPVSSGQIKAVHHSNRGLWVISGAGNFIATSYDGVNWKQQEVLPIAGSLLDIKYNGKDLWVTGTAGGIIFISPDAIVWTMTFGPSFQTINGVEHDGLGTWVTVGPDGDVQTSPDGITWTMQTSGFGATTINSVAHDKHNLWVIVGNSGTISTSPDGVTWTLGSSGTANNLHDVEYNGKDLWVAVGASGTIITSPDGFTWTLQPLHGFSTNLIRSVHYNGKDLWIAGSDGGEIGTSPDGVHWAEQLLTGLGGFYGIYSATNSNAGSVGYGSLYNGTGIQGFGGGNLGIGVEGFGGDGYGVGVKGIGGSSGGTGIEGHGGPTDGYGVVGVGGAGASGGIGVFGLGGGDTGDGVLGQGKGNGFGVIGAGGDTGTGIFGIAGADGYGGIFKGGASKAGLIGIAGDINADGIIGHGSGDGTGISGYGGSSGGPGLQGHGGPGGAGIVGVGIGTGIGIIGTGGGFSSSVQAPNIRTGVVGLSGSSAPGVQGMANGAFPGVHGIGSASGGTSGVKGESNNTSDPGVWGVNSISNVNGKGVYGQNTGSGYGVVAEATASSPTRAAFRIVPQGSVQPSSTPQAGDIWMQDSGKPQFSNGTKFHGGRFQEFRIDADSSVFSGTTEAAFSNGTYSIPADTLVLGSMLRICAWVVVTHASGSNRDFTLRVRYNTAAGTVLHDHTITLATGTTQEMYIETEEYFITIGATGATRGSRRFCAGAPSTDITLVTRRAGQTANANMRTDTTRTVNITGQWSSAGTGLSAILKSFWVETSSGNEN